jgi:hypothetical protein
MVKSPTSRNKQVWLHLSRLTTHHPKVFGNEHNANEGGGIDQTPPQQKASTTDSNSTDKAWEISVHETIN